MNGLDTFLTYGLIAPAFVSLFGIYEMDWIGVNEYGSEVNGYSVDVGENGCDVDAMDCIVFKLCLLLYLVSEVWCVLHEKIKVQLQIHHLILSVESAI